MNHDLIRTDDAISILEMMLAVRNSPATRSEIEATLHDLRLAKADPAVREALHYPPDHEIRDI